MPQPKYNAAHVDALIDMTITGLTQLFKVKAREFLGEEEERHSDPEPGQSPNTWILAQKLYELWAKETVHREGCEAFSPWVNVGRSMENKWYSIAYAAINYCAAVK